MKLLKTTFVLFILVLLCFLFVGCKKSISTYEELIAINSEEEEEYELTADIDCNFNTISSPIYLANLDGQGYTIKNSRIFLPRTR